MTREEHQELVAVIRSVHEKLRLDYQTNGDGDRVWKDHCEDIEMRSKYAESMLQLATSIWPYKDRIEWCYHTMREYFFGDGLEHSLRRHYRKMGLPCSESILEQAREVLELAEEKVRLLDVGSCYNPFSAYTDIDALAIDLTPATELEENKLGSVGTPQGSVISPLLFNLVMIGVGNRLERVTGVRHTIYADDVTLWVPGRSDGHIETTLQKRSTPSRSSWTGLESSALRPSQSCW
ncbi:S-adenosylmethionine sensor upstream of mTORC1 [Dermacentor silvarum]|uniref:S-adenosylmethionine sensor upstream of mTORC1 n=1 Tax=Dermacentor silvarum TaxID=543639 RepID=UPI00210071BB|nr:S-adenosylmethionine sensor upstream of mTORC1 [Dermacentor silvarum]